MVVTAAGELTLPSPEIHPDAFVASTARVLGRVRIDARAVLMFGAVVRAEFDSIEVGAETNLQDNAILHCDEGFPCRVGRRVAIGHAAVVHGATVGDRCLIGAGAVVLNGAEVGEGAWLAAGSVLPEGKQVPPWTLAVGTPAKPVRELTTDEITRQDEGVDNYLTLAAAYWRLRA